MMKQVNIRIPVRMWALVVGLFLTLGAFAQITVKGHVKDATGEAIIGATVRVLGTQEAAVSDFDGNFTVKAAQGADVQVSYMGYQTATVKAAASVVITLQEDAQTLENVVVIGYGRAKKSDLTGSVTAIKPDELSKGITNNPSDMLVGKVAGVDVITAGGAPGAGAQIRIRGGSSLNATNDPLYVIDGLIIDGGTVTGMSNPLANINPNDIETFTVLKDASATAIYGSRASNGVIIITTKKGKGGQAPKVVYNGNVTISHTQKRYDALSGDEYRALWGRVDGLDATTLGTANTDWQDQIFRTSVSTSHNVSIAGGLKHMPYRISAGYLSDDGIVKTSWMNRATGSINLAPSLLNEHLNFNITAKYMFEKDSYVDAGAAIGSALSMDPTRPVYFDPADSDAAYTDGYYQTIVSGTLGTWTRLRKENVTQNPLAYLEQNSILAHSSDWSGNAEVDYKIHGFEDLHIHGNLGAQYTEAKQFDSNSPYSYGNPYYGYEKETRSYKYSIVGNIYAQYMKEFGAHFIDVMAGAEQSHYHSNGYNFGSGKDLNTGAIYTTTQALRSQTEWATHSSLVSYFGRLNYTLLDRYMLTATMRADGSSRFAKGKKWGYFPSVALAWKINDEPFMKNLTWWNEFKLRLGWGKTGQQGGISEFLYTSVYTISNDRSMYPLGDTYYYTTRPSVSNPDLTWEKTTTWNAGLDFGFLNNRFTLSVDAYYRKTTDLLNNVRTTVMQSLGEQVMTNIGSMKNYGAELTLGVKPVVTKDFMWDLSYNVSYNKNEITELNGADDDSYYVPTGTTISRGLGTTVQVHKVGYPAASYFVYQQVYDEAGKPIEGVYVDRNADGIINEADRYIYKKPAADVFMGLTSKFIYKAWDLSFSLRASLNNYVYYDNLSNYASISASGLNPNGTPSNTNPESVKLGFTGLGGSNYWLSDYFVRNASFLRCTNITLGYTFPALFSHNGKSYLDGRIYATAQNPFIITKYDGLDPEVAGGIDKNPYPRPFSVQVGLNLNF